MSTVRPPTSDTVLVFPMSLRKSACSRKCLEPFDPSIENKPASSKPSALSRAPAHVLMVDLSTKAPDTCNMSFEPTHVLMVDSPTKVSDSCQFDSEANYATAKPTVNDSADNFSENQLLQKWTSDNMHSDTLKSTLNDARRELKDVLKIVAHRVSRYRVSPAFPEITLNKNKRISVN